MPYYSKEEVQDYFRENLKIIESDQKKHRLLSSPEELAGQFKNDEDILGIFWTTALENDIEMNGKAFIKIEPDLYTDDRFAIDSQIAVRENVTVGDVIRKRQMQQDQAKKHIDDKSPEELLKLLK
jgi:hypothetical protein|tara:strand:+ start:21413 stop:21787 length:375 start_codon:yes stop_codon:yes gene_type:complete